MPADDDTRDRRQFVRGPHRPQQTAGSIYDAYVNTGAYRRQCPNCDAKPFNYCRHGNGRLRKAPCPQRLSEKQA